MSTRTDKVPNTSATAASRAATPWCGGAGRLPPDQVAPRVVAAAVFDCDSGEVHSTPASHRHAARRSNSARCVRRYKQRVPLFAEGSIAHPTFTSTSRRRAAGPFITTPMAPQCGSRGGWLYRTVPTIRTDILHDAGDSISPIVDRGQIEGAFSRGSAGSPSKSCYGTRRGASARAAPQPTSCPRGPKCPRSST